MTEEIRYIANLQRQEEFDNEVTELKDELKRLEQDRKQLTQWLDEARRNADFWCDKCTSLEQENKELLEARNHFMGVNLKYFNALEEIRILATKNVSIENFVKIQNKINECLGG